MEVSRLAAAGDKRFFVESTYYDVATGQPLPEKHYVNRTLQLPPVVSPDEKLVAETGYRAINVLDADTRKSRFTVKPANLGFDGLGEQHLGALAENLLQRLLRPWHADERSVNFLHGGVLLKKKGSW